MLEPKRLSIDLSGLWEESDDNNISFIIRFLDINEKNQRQLALRIKKAAPQSKIRNYDNPNIEKIYQTLKEINPIIFKEHSNPNPRHPWQGFGSLEAYTLTGWNFKAGLCKAVYLMACLNRPLTRSETFEIARLSYNNYNQLNHWFLTIWPLTSSNNQQNTNVITSIPEIGIEELAAINNALPF